MSSVSLASGAAEQARVRIPSALYCAVVVAGVKLALRSAGLRRTLRAIHTMAPPARATRGRSLEQVESVARRVALVGAFFPGRVACLEQSLTLYWLLLRARIPASFRIGVLPSQFAAHAWVEYDGEPVLESELVHTVIPFPVLPL